MTKKEKMIAEQCKKFIEKFDKNSTDELLEVTGKSHDSVYPYLFGMCMGLIKELEYIAESK